MLLSVLRSKKAIAVNVAHLSIFDLLVRRLGKPQFLY
jgi:hypothetical protein